MNLEDKVNYLANLTFIMDFHEKLGTIKNPWIVKEFQKGHDEIVKELEEKHVNEARTRIAQRASGPEGRTELQSREPWRSGPVGSASGSAPSSGAALPRPRI